MKLNKITFTIITLFSSITFSAQDVCIQLEGISIGCVPSESHTCFRNKNIEIAGGSGYCKYTKLELTGTQYLAPRGAIAFECASPPVIETTCVKQPGSDSQVCTTTSTCKEWSKPVCQEICILCHKQEHQPPKTVVGCIVCTRPYCKDAAGNELEPKPNASCPTIDPTDPTFVLPKVKRPLCGGQRCDLTATDPNGITHDVTITRQNCPDPVMVEAIDGAPQGRSCPWIGDPAPYILRNKVPLELNADSTAAEVVEGCANVFPIKEPNRFPQDWTKPK